MSSLRLRSGYSSAESTLYDNIVVWFTVVSLTGDDLSGPESVSHVKVWCLLDLSTTPTCLPVWNFSHYWDISTFSPFALAGNVNMKQTLGSERLVFKCAWSAKKQTCNANGARVNINWSVLHRHASLDPITSEPPRFSSYLVWRYTTQSLCMLFLFVRISWENLLSLIFFMGFFFVFFSLAWSSLTLVCVGTNYDTTVVDCAASILHFAFITLFDSLYWNFVIIALWKNSSEVTFSAK